MTTAAPTAAHTHGLLDALGQRARVSPHQRALRFQRQGAWRSQSWAQFKLTVELATHVWRSLGVGAGSHIALIGPLSELALATVLAAEVLGGTAEWVPSGHAGDVPVRADAWLVDGAVDLSGLPDAAWRDGLVVLRQGQGAQSGNEGRLHAFDQLLAALPDAVVPAWPAASALSRPRKGPSVPTWFVAGLSHGATLQALLRLWLSQAWVLALPEPGGNVHLDRQAMQPDGVIDTPEGLAALARHASDRWPAVQGVRSRLMAWALAARGGAQLGSITRVLAASQGRAAQPWGVRSWLAARVLRHLGLSRARVLVVDGGATSGDEAWAARLGLPVQTWSAFEHGIALSRPVDAASVGGVAPGPVPDAPEFDSGVELSGLSRAAS